MVSCGHVHGDCDQGGDANYESASAAVDVTVTLAGQSALGVAAIPRRSCSAVRARVGQRGSVTGTISYAVTPWSVLLGDGRHADRIVRARVP